ncbi:MAG TPA: LysR family transcriptional regulator [Actinocrinis sp.]|nr:LysR family transcriptional regulator [Actinocrinis sp.]
MDARRLHLLAELDRLGTIAAVADELHLSASGISMQLTALEKEVGVPLTERQGRRVALTAAGRILAGHGRDVADLLAVAAMEAQALREGTAGTYRVAAFPTAVRSFVADTWALLAGEPERGIRLRVAELEPQDALPDLAAGRVDLAVVHAYTNMAQPAGTGTVTTRVASEPVLLATRADDPAGSAGDGRADLEDFAHRDWVVSDRRLTCWEMTRRACGAAGFEPRAAAEATDYASQLALVSAGAGVALIPALGTYHIPDNVALRTLRAPVRRHIFVAIRRAGAADPALKRLIGLLAEAARTALAEVRP